MGEIDRDGRPDLSQKSGQVGIVCPDLSQKLGRVGIGRPESQDQKVGIGHPDLDLNLDPTRPNFGRDTTPSRYLAHSW